MDCLPHSLTHPPTPTHSLTRSRTHPPTHSLIHLFTYSPMSSLASASGGGTTEPTRVQSHEVFELRFHGVEYLATLEVRVGGASGAARGGNSSPAELHLGIEQKDNSNRWKGMFTAAYLEDISLKTGNFKKFDVFVEMLRTALASQSDTVFVDLLTFADLQMLKSRHAKPAAGGHDTANSSTTAGGSSNQKRYLILTYAVEFDRVHYPLPLHFNTAPSPRDLQATIARLRRELAHAKRKATSSGQQQQQQQQQQLLQLSGIVNGANGASVPEQEYVLLQRRYDQLKLEAQQKLQMARNERDALLQEIDALQASQSEAQTGGLVASLRADLAKARRKNAALVARSKAAETEHRLEVADLQNTIARLSTGSGSRRRTGGTTRGRSSSNGRAQSSGYGQRRSRSPASAGSRNVHSSGVGKKKKKTGARTTGFTSSRLTKQNLQRQQQQQQQQQRRQLQRRATSRGSVSSSGRSGQRRARSRSTSRGRFDPTAYVKERNARIEAARRARSASPSGRSVGSRGSRGLSVGSRGSRGSAGSRKSKSSVRSSASTKSRGQRGRAHNGAVLRKKATKPSIERATRPAGSRQDVRSSRQPQQPQSQNLGAQRVTSYETYLAKSQVDKENDVTPLRQQSGPRGPLPKQAKAQASHAGRPPSQHAQSAVAFGAAPASARHGVGDAAPAQYRSQAPDDRGKTVSQHDVGDADAGKHFKWQSLGRADIARNGAGNAVSASSVGAGSQSTVGGTPEADMADLDRRLHVIQEFLKAAKST